jgi:putative MFS transporter
MATIPKPQAADLALPASSPIASFWSAVRGYPLRAFFICLCGVSLENMDQAIFQFVLPQIISTFKWSEVQLGWYLAITFTLAGMSIAGLGVLTDRVGRKKVFQTSMLVGSLFVAMMYWAPSTFSMLALRTLGFATGGIQSPVVGTIVVEESPPRYRGLLSGVLQIGYPLGWFLASQSALLVLGWYGEAAWNAGAWRYAFFISLLSIPYMWLISKFLKETRAFLAAKQAREAAAGAGAEAAASQRQSRLTELFSRGLRFKTIMLFCGEFFHVFAYGSTLLLNVYFQKFRHWPARDAIAVVGLSYGVGALGYVLAAFVGEFVMRRRNVIILWAQLGSISFAALIWLAESYWATVTSYCLMTIFFYGTTAVKFTFIAENFPARLRATGVTFAGSLAVNLGIAFGPLAMGYAITHLGWNWAYTVCGIAAIFLSGMFFISLPADPKEIKEEEQAV